MHLLSQASWLVQVQINSWPVSRRGTTLLSPVVWSTAAKHFYAAVSAANGLPSLLAWSNDSASGAVDGGTSDRSALHGVVHSLHPLQPSSIASTPAAADRSHATTPATATSSAGKADTAAAASQAQPSSNAASSEQQGTVAVVNAARTPGVAVVYMDGRVALDGEQPAEAPGGGQRDQQVVAAEMHNNVLVTVLRGERPTNGSASLRQQYTAVAYKVQVCR